MSWGIYVTKNSIPKTPTKCPVGECVYNGESMAGVCDDPRINRGNSDAKCHTMKPIELVEILNKAG
jgi:hypothetical protein